MPPDELRTCRLRLRRAEPDDLEAFHALLSDARAMRHWSTPPHPDLATTREWLGRMMATRPEDGLDFVVEHRGRLIGKAGCHRIPEIGFLIDPACWRQGFAREALTAIIPHVFANWPIPAILADVDPRNAASLGLLGRLGFREARRAARTFLIDGEWSDSLYLALDRPADGGAASV